MIKTIFLFFILVLIIIAVIYYLKTKDSKKIHSNIHKEVQEKSSMYKDRVMRLFESKDRITINDIESNLLITDSEASQYLKELEKERKIKKIGSKEYIYYIKIEENKKSKRK